MSTSTHLQTLIRNIPHSPGVYQFYDTGQQLLYVGKAKDLRKRVGSYFTKSHDSARTAIMVRRIADIRYIVVGNEYDALLLENNLIKKHQPRYNVNLKDDKTYPWIIVKKEPFPRVFYTRNKIADGSRYFGPYPSAGMVHTLLDLVHGLYKLRTCSLRLTPGNIKAKKFKVCLEYHIGNCKGPCEGLQTEADYDNGMGQIMEILKGNTASVIRRLKARMQEFSENMDFEEAQSVKEQLSLLEGFRSKSIIVHPSISNVDVFSIINSDEKTAYVNFLKVMNGSIVQAQTIEVRKKLNERDDELLGLAIPELRERFGSTAGEVLVPAVPDAVIEGVRFTVPMIGDKKHLLELSLKNAFQYRREKLNRMEKLDPGLRTDRILSMMRDDLRMRELPRHIECFDNSNFQGTYPVAAMSVFMDTKPTRSRYRHFNIRTVTGPDDFASMEEVIYRRYRRMLDQEDSLPQLIIIDGGKGQLGSAIKSLVRVGLAGRITVVGIAKKLEEIYFPGDPIPLYLDKKGDTLKVIQRLRDEAHRFGIRHHRKRRSKGVIQTELSGIDGIGEATANKLLQHFKSVRKIREAPLEDLEAVAGKARAKKIRAHFGKNP